MKENLNAIQESPKKEAPVEPIARGFQGHFYNGLGMLLTRLFTRFEKKGLELLPKESPYLIVANHVTYVDGMWIGNLLSKDHFKKYCALVGSDLMTDYGYFGKIICHVGQGIPIDRKSNPVRGLILAKKQVEAGHILLVHPEGTRSQDGSIQTFQDGAAYIAKKAQVPIVPVFIDGGYQIFNRHWSFPKPFLSGTLKRKHLRLQVGPIFDPSGYASPKELTAALQIWFEEQQKHALYKKF